MPEKRFAQSNRCYLCEEELETVNHLLLHCKIARQYWNFLQYLRDLLDHMPEYEGIIGEYAALGNTLLDHMPECEGIIGEYAAVENT